MPPAELQVWAATQAADETEVGLPLPNLSESSLCIGHHDPDTNEREARVERSQDVREGVLVGDRTGREHEFARHLVRRARQRPQRLGVQVENAASIVVEPKPGLGERHPAPLTAENSSVQLTFKVLDALANGRLGDTQSPRGCREARPLGRSHKGVEER